MQTAQTKQKAKRTFLAKLCFDFMTHILPVEWIFASAKRAVIRVYDEMGNMIQTHEHADDFKEW
jgi:hypothetical protein